MEVQLEVLRAVRCPKCRLIMVLDAVLDKYFCPSCHKAGQSKTYYTLQKHYETAEVCEEPCPKERVPWGKM